MSTSTTNTTSRNFYACQCFFKGKNERTSPFGKTVFVFKSDKEREEFLVGKDDKEFFKVTQKEAFKIADLNKKESVPCVYEHSQLRGNFVLANIRQCWGNTYQFLKQFELISK